jgi:uncharacterized protein (TIGR02118 family)
MVKLTVLYGPPEDPAAFEDYYRDTHVPLVDEIPDLAKFEASRVVGTPDGSDAPYHRIAELWFESVEVLQAAMGSDAGQAAVADIPNFASGGATVVISDID